MHFTSADEAVAAALVAIKEAQPRCGATKVVAIDGPSGAGKTDFAAALAERLPDAHVLHMDDMYAGWEGGLDEAVASLHQHVLAPLARGDRAAYQRWDWEHSEYAEWQVVPAASLLLVEGVGSGAKPGAELESTLIWIEADRDLRFRRGIDRDGESYLPHWQRWAVQEEALFANDRTRDRADLTLNTTP
jgi:uridine kinase